MSNNQTIVNKAGGERALVPKRTRYAENGRSPIFAPVGAATNTTKKEKKKHKNKYIYKKKKHHIYAAAK